MKLLDQVSLRAEEPERSDVCALLQAALDHSNQLYRAESCHGLNVAELSQSGANLQVARYNGEAIGCGALVLSNDRSGELKSFWVAPEFRGKGVATALLQKLRNLALQEGLSVLRLETGIYHPIAIALYEKAGFRHIGPFGSYKPDPLSVFMELHIQ